MHPLPPIASLVSRDTEASTKQVLLLVESSRAYGRGCLAGISAFLRDRSNWRIVHIERSLAEGVPEEVRRQRFDGVIARIETSSMADAIAEMGVPAVDIRGVFCPDGGVSFDTDPEACAALALDHFRGRGFRRLGYCGYPGLKFSDQRQNHFTDFCAEAATDVTAFESPGHLRENDPPRGEDTVASELGGELDRHEIARWIGQLPTPIGIFACNDVRARQVLRAAIEAGKRVPDEVGVLGVDDDEVICDLCNPPLSSIEPDTFRIGFEAAEWLERLMAGQLPSQPKFLIAPRRVATRRSTDVIMVEDPSVCRALSFIREQACAGIGVAEVVKSVNVSRATLERRFRQSIGRTPREEIERVRMERIRLLLAETTYGLGRIAELTGYRTSTHLITAFRRAEGCTPGEFRKRIG